MSNTLCTQCGGITGDYILTSVVPKTGFCGGHKGSEGVRIVVFPRIIDRPIPGTQGTAFVHEYDPSKEILSLPKGSSIYPSDYFQQIEVLWQIAQEVAETDSTYVANVNFDESPAEYFCPFCEGILTPAILRSETGRPLTSFPHDAGCIVTKARELVEQRKQTPQITAKIEQPKVPASCALCGKRYEGAPGWYINGHWIEEKRKAFCSKEHLDEWMEFNKEGE
jgi:hypothetical protein